jgi:hypothetical protein
MGFIKIKQFFILLLVSLLFFSCRSRGPYNPVWHSKKHPSDELRKEYKDANKQGLKDYKNSKKRFTRSHKKKGQWF